MRTTWLSLGLILTVSALCLPGCADESVADADADDNPVAAAPAALGEADQADAPRGKARKLRSPKDGKLRRGDRGEPRPRGRRGQALGQRLEKMDLDSDGKITEAEVRQAANVLFTELDADADGSLAPDELPARQGGKARRGSGGPGRGGRLLERADQDGNGALSLDELTAALLERFEGCDSDGDGTVTAAELKAAAERRGPRGRRFDRPERGERAFRAEPAPAKPL
jgi:Ca2+-binding EF-hand superfamily protein